MKYPGSARLVCTGIKIEHVLWRGRRAVLHATALARTRQCFSRGTDKRLFPVGGQIAGEEAAGQQGIGVRSRMSPSRTKGVPGPLPGTSGVTDSIDKPLLLQVLGRQKFSLLWRAGFPAGS